MRLPCIVLFVANALALRSRASILTVTDTDWEALSRSVSGRLYDGVPFMTPCFTNYNGAVQVPDFSRCAHLHACVGNPGIASPMLKGCRQGGVPRNYVQIHTVKDVQETLRFAEAHDLRAVIKNIGHDFRGGSSAPDSLALWMHTMQPPMQLQRSFIADGCSGSSGDAITYGSSRRWVG